MSVFRSSKQLSNVCSSGGCSSRSTQRQQTTSAHIWHRHPNHKETKCLAIFYFSWVHFIVNKMSLRCFFCKHLGCSAANRSIVYCASAAPRQSRQQISGESTQH